MKKFEEMWEELKPYLSCEKGLDEGYYDGKYTRYFARYCKHIIGIDISSEFYEEAKENLKDLDNVELKIMDAANVEYPDKYFGVILCTSFHEFDLSGKEKFKMDLDLKRKILEEMTRLSDTIVFAEIDPDNLSAELYKVFNPIEDHALRTKKSNELIDKVLREKGYKLLLCDRAVDKIFYKTKEEFKEDMLSWWAEVHVPENENEKQKMLDKIEKILESRKFLTNLCFDDVFRYTVYKRDSKGDRE